jgi:hypothetical protein
VAVNERWTFAAGHIPDPIVLVLFGLVLGLAAWEAVRAFLRPRSPRPRKVGLLLLGLRVLGLLALSMLVFELTLRVDQVGPSGRRIVVLVDRSASMALPDAPAPDEETTTRQARVESMWAESEDSRTGWRDEGYVLDVRGFDSKTQPYTGELADTLHGTPDGGASDLARALSELQQGGTDDVPLSGVVVISDGLVAADSAADEHLSSVATSLGVPITTVSAGAPAIKDVAVAEVRAGEFAFVENVTELEATIVAHGYTGAGTDVELLRDGEVVARRRVALPGDDGERVVRFEVAPDRIGQFVYEIAVQPQPGEATTDNNRRAFVVKVLRDKVRVLHVAGRPDWDVRALRTLLRRDPNVELLSYYILRGFDDIQREDTTAPLSLIPFPTDELFEEELGSFDVVILHNFDAELHQVAQYIDNIAQYVTEGGALVLIGGDLGPTDPGYGGSAISALLPVDSRRPAPLRHSAFRPRVTEAGRRHPITAWLSGSDGLAWESLPELPNYNPMSLARHADQIGASALLVHPSDVDADGRPRPILAVAEPGKGRTMVLSTGATWRLGFAPDLPLIDGARPYDLLWLGAVRWLLHDDTSGRLRLETDRPRYRVGEPVELTAETVTAAYAPEPDVKVTWEVRPLVEGGTADTPPLRAGAWTTDGLGRAREPIADLPVGAYEAIARRELGAAEGEPEPPPPPPPADGSDPAATNPEDALGQHEVRRVFIVEPPGRELARVDADPGIERLAALAKATGGESLSAVEGDTLPRSLPLGDPFVEGSSVRVDARRELPLWNGWIAWALLAVGFGGEWLVRRRAGEA